MLVSAQNMEVFLVEKFPITDHEHVQDAEIHKKEVHALKYHIPVLPDSCNLKDVVAFT